MGTNQNLDSQELLHLISLKEVLGGFAHEIRQPLNAFSLAGDVIRLKIERSGLPEEEVAFIRKQLERIANQVGRAEELVAGLREFSREGETSEGRVDLAASFEKVHRLMRQQFVSRQIDLGWDGADNVPQIPQSRHLVERIIVQAMAYARDTLQSMQTWHEEKAAPYKKTLEINWANVEGHCVMQFLWDSGNVPAGAFLIDPMSRTGLMLAQTLLAAEGGALEITESSLKITFPAEDNPQ